MIYCNTCEIKDACCNYQKDGHCNGYDIDIMERVELKELCKNLKQENLELELSALENKMCQHNIIRLKEAYKKLKLENKQLKKYVQHKKDCDISQLRYGEILCVCTCGLGKLLKKKL